jgi:elongation factor 3
METVELPRETHLGWFPRDDTRSDRFDMSLLDPPSNILDLLQSEARDEEEEVLSYCAFLISGLAGANNFDSDEWKDVLQPYLSNNVDWQAVCSAVRELTEDDADSYGSHDDDGEEVICDLRFNLAYGGKILLHQTRLHLVQGRRYALVGPNGVGKTTLMNAIGAGKIDGWPKHLTTAYVDSGSNVDLAYEAQIVIEHLQSSTQKPRDECVEKLKELDFKEEMIEGTIGALSGGWQMKLRLIRAILVDPDIYLLDEPTNHLSESAVDWITQYLLNNLTHQTVVVVSHDSNFLETVCTDVIHYEQRAVWGPYRRLVHYKGKMSDFVKLQPQAAHYFELSVTDNLSFKFPEPGRLEGVKTSTQKFMEMEHVDFRYPNAKANTLTDIHLKMTLSSRVCVLGPNGAGKTTLIRLIVGETLPSNLGACKFHIHPNLRVAYVAQVCFPHDRRPSSVCRLIFLSFCFFPLAACLLSRGATYER